jgi:HSP20 family protein
MPLTTIDPFVLEFDRLAQRVFGPATGTARVRAVMPMDVIRRKDEVLIRFDLPGVDPESIDVTVDREVLSVTAKRAEEAGEDEKLITRERVTGTFTRRVFLGDSLDSEKIEAAYTDGVLAVRLPLLAKAQPRKVEIHTDGKKGITA